MIHKEKPAFPSTPATTEWREGITIRDYFAAKAMQGYISTFSSEDPCCNVDDLKEDISEMSYKVADAMLKERES